MPSEPYLSRYQGLSHQQLYDLLKAGRNNQVSDLSGRWSQMRDISTHLGATLHAELTALGRTWTGEASTEYQRRLSAVVEFSSWVSREFTQIESATGVMASQLQEAQKSAEAPSATDGNDHMVQQATSNIAKFSAFGAPISVAAGIVGAIDGHNQDEQARQRAHQQMVNLVADLAGEYDRNAAVSFTTDLPAPPAALPGAVESGLAADVIARIIAAARAAALAVGGAVATSSAHIASSSGHAAVTLRAPTPDHHTDAGLLGTGSLVGAHGSPAHSGHGGVDISGGELLAGGGGLSLGLGLAARSAMNSGGGGTTGAAGANFGTRTNPASDPVLGKEPDPNAAANVRAGQAAARSASGIAQGRAAENEPDEHDTWLTEDDMDWGGDDAAPPILGERPGGDESTRPGPTSE
jgi:uncharacterized protein YukE